MTGLERNLLTLRLAAYVNKAPGDTSNRYTWSVFQYFTFAQDPETLEKSQESGRDTETEKESRRWIGIAAHKPCKVGRNAT
jgi:hypothetical protein